MPDIVALVPFSSNDSSRIEIWGRIKAWWEQNVQIPIFVGEDTSEHFNISLARNDAAQKAGDWNIAVILDSDTLVSPEQISAGIELARKTDAVTYPFTERWELDDVGTNMFLKDENSNWQQHAGLYQRVPLGGCIIVTRKLWDIVGGFDPGFIGWGHEDGAFMLACTVLGKQEMQRVPGKVLHLEHAPAKTKSPTNPIYLANRKRYELYVQAVNGPNPEEDIRKLLNNTTDAR